MVYYSGPRLECVKRYVDRDFASLQEKVQYPSTKMARTNLECGLVCVSICTSEEGLSVKAARPRWSYPLISNHSLILDYAAKNLLHQYLRRCFKDITTLTISP